MARKRRPPSGASQSTVAPSMPESRSSLEAQNTAAAQFEPRRRTTRSNAGTNGRAEQLMMIGQALVGPPKTPRPMTMVPEGEPVNPMAPTPVRKTRGAKKRNATDANNVIQEEIPLPRHDEDGSETRNPVPGSPNSRFGFKFNSPPRPAYVGSQNLDAYQKRQQRSLPLATPTIANRRQRVTHTVVAPPAPILDRRHVNTPLSDLSELPEGEASERQDNGERLSSDLYDEPGNDMDDLYDNPVDGAFFVNTQAADDATQGLTEDERRSDEGHAGGQSWPNEPQRETGDAATVANSEDEEHGPPPREINIPVRRSFNFQNNAIRPLQNISPQNHASLLGGKRFGDLDARQNPPALQRPSSQTAPRVSDSRRSTSRQPQAQGLPSPPISRANSGDSANDGTHVSHRAGDEQAGMSYDVLKRHYATNHRHRPPSSNYLDNVREHGSRRASKRHRDPSPSESEEELQVEHEEEPEGDMSENEKIVGEEEQTTQLVVREKKDTNLSFYPKRWQTLLDLAKARMRLHVAAEDAFPRLEVAVDTRCREVLLEAIAFFKTKQWKLEIGIYPLHRPGMCRLIFNDSQTFRSDLKKEVARGLHADYNIYPPLNARGEEERIAQIKAKAAELLSSAAYLRGDPDINGKASNFAHCGLRRPCLAFYYSASKKALRQFPEFQSHVPYKALTLVSAVVYGLLTGLREYGDSQLAFDKTSWSTIESAQEQLDQQLSAVLEHEYHGPKLNAMLEDWAKAGMTGYKGKTKVTAQTQNEFAMILD